MPHIIPDKKNKTKDGFLYDAVGLFFLDFDIVFKLVISILHEFYRIH